MALKSLFACFVVGGAMCAPQGCLLMTNPWPPDASRDVIDVHRIRGNQIMVDGGSTDVQEDTTVILPDASGGPVVRFHVPSGSGPVAFASVPYPSDLYLDATGHLSIGALPIGPAALTDTVALFSASLARLDGFGVTSAAFFAVDGAQVDPASLATGVHAYDVTTCAEIPLRLTWRPDQSLIVAALGPGVVLREHTRYGFVLTTSLHTSTGTAIGPSAEYQAIRDAATAPTEPRARVAFDDSEAAIHCATTATAPIARGQVIAATRFTTQNVRRTLRSIHDQIFLAPAPAPRLVHAIDSASLDAFLGVPRPDTDGMIHAGGDNPGGVVHSHISWVIHGNFAALSYIAAQRFQKGSFDYDASGNPRVKGLIPVRFTLVLPTVTSGSFANLPVVVYSHGFTTTRSAIFDVADSYCARGFAVVGIDLPFHGERNAASIDVENNVTGSAGMDYIGDSVGADSAVDFFDLNGDTTTGVMPIDPTVMRDTLRQAIADIMQEVRMMRDGDFAAIRAADPSLATLSFDRNHLALTGNSFGGFMVGSVEALTPEAGLVMMTVPAAGLAIPSLVDSATFQPALGPFVLGAFDLYAETDLDANNYLLTPDDSSRHPRWSPMWNLFQTTLEPGDALSFAPYMFEASRGTRPAAVFVIEAYADEVVPNQATEPYAAALGLPYLTVSATTAPPGPHWATLARAAAPVTGNLPSGATGGIVQFSPANHGIASSHRDLRDYQTPSPPLVPLAAQMSIFNDVDAAQRMLAGLLASWVAGTGAPTIPDPYR